MTLGQRNVARHIPSGLCPLLQFLLLGFSVFTKPTRLAKMEEIGHWRKLFFKRNDF
jgi:hypothetical protein